MPHLELTTTVDAAIEACFDANLDVDLHTRSTGAHETIVGGVRSGRMGLDDEVTWRAVHFGLPFRMTSRIIEYRRPVWFVDEQIRGPFASWRHEHRFTPSDTGATIVEDVVDFTSPFGPVGRLVDTMGLRRYMKGLLEQRNAFLKAEVESAG